MRVSRYAGVLLLLPLASACIVVTSTRTGQGTTPGSGSSSVTYGPVLPASYADDSASVAAVIQGFHAALEAGDSTAALGLLDDEVMILESGGVESRQEYRSHHLPSDIAFARAVRSVRGPMTVRIVGDVAWAMSSSSTQGEFRGRPVNSSGAELVVLIRRTAGWRINAIHWSSRQRRS